MLYRRQETEFKKVHTVRCLSSTAFLLHQRTSRITSTWKSECSDPPVFISRAIGPHGCRLLVTRTSHDAHVSMRERSSTCPIYYCLHHNLPIRNLICLTGMWTQHHKKHNLIITLTNLVTREFEINNSARWLALAELIT